MNRTLWILLFIIAAQSLYYYPLMPDVLAMHFEGDGTPNGWGSRTVVFSIYYAMVVLLYVSFVSLPFWLTLLPEKYLNIPENSAFQGPDRIKQIHIFLRKQLLLFGAVTTLFIIYVMQLLFMANLTESKALHSSFIWMLLIYFVYMTYWTIYFIRSMMPQEDEKLCLNKKHRFFKTILPAKAFRALIKGTRNWLVECPVCKEKRDYWDAGGIRYKAVGEQREYSYCKKCKRWVWFKVRRKTEQEKQNLGGD